VPGGDRTVIQRKLAIPEVTERALGRPRLERLLAMLVERYPVVWVAATAGAGKTTAVVQAARAIERPVAWLTLDGTDAAPGRLVTYLEAALARRAPQVEGVGTGALARRIAHAEAAGLLAEAVGTVPVLLVIDELERLAEAPEALAALGGFVRYAPPTMRVVLVSRRELAVDMGNEATLGRVAAVGEGDLAFTTEEAARALADVGRGEVDPIAAVEATGGWVAGVLFEAWRSEDHVAGLGGEADPLYGYLSSQILEQLDDDDREFLVATSLLEEVTPAAAEALGQHAAGDRLLALRAAHLPVTWSGDALAMRCHTRFREFLLECLQRRGEEQVRALRAAHGQLLTSEGHDEDAVEELLRAGQLEGARAAAERVIAGVIERLDLAVAERWLGALADVGPDGGPLSAAEVMLAIGREEYGRGVRLADRLDAGGQRERLARASGPAASMMAWCYWHGGRIADARAVIDGAEPSPEIDAIRYLLALVDGEADGAALQPALSGGPLDALVMRVHYAHGRLPHLAATPASRWAAAVSAPWRISTLRATGHTEQALELYEAQGAASWAAVWLHAIVGVEILIDLRRTDEARAALLRARELIGASESQVYDMLSLVMESKLELRLRRDARAAREILGALERRPAAREYGFVAEQVDTWTGYADLLDGDVAAALRRLRAATARMLASDRILELPTAAVYLAEAEWRNGDEDGADRAADLALAAAAKQGSNHLLLQALVDLPAVVARRIDAEPDMPSPWHDLGRALLAQGVAVGSRVGPLIELEEFGRKALTVNGTGVRPRIAKAYEVVAYLASCPDQSATRDELLDALFDGRADASARAYLRQAFHRLREVLPAGVELTVERARVALGEGAVIRSESARAEGLLAQAARLRGDERLQATLDALELLERGEYLPGVRTVWAQERRRHLDAVGADARFEAAELAFAAGRYSDAERLTAAVLRDDPYREAAWRLQMRLAGAVGDEDRVIGAFRGCERALGELGARPAGATRHLLDALRR
jgi:DNA-binding SARP family transcriptional activator/tetratricopeptide (TPR) repeat protein